MVLLSNEYEMDSSMFKLQHRYILTFLIATCLPTTSFSAPGDPGNILNTLTINNVTGDGRFPSSPQGITMHDGYLWVVDFGTDRIYRVYPEDTYDDQGTVNTSDDILSY